MNPFLLFFVFFANDFQIQLDELGFYEPGIQFYSFDDKYIIISSLDGGIAIVDPSGKVTKRYVKKGMGPGELQFPFVLGISNDSITVVSNYRNVIEFNQNLVPNTKEFPPLPPAVMSGKIILHGFQTGNKQFLLIQQPWASNPFAITELNFSKKKWVEGANYFPKIDDSGDPMSLRTGNYKFNLHNKVFFKSLAMAIDWYEVSLFHTPQKKGDDNNTIQVLAGNVENLPMHKPGFRAYVSESFQTSFGYVVTLEVNFLPAGQPLKYVADLFDNSGKFLKRIDIDSNVVPCINCDKVLIEGQNSSGIEVLKNIVLEDH